MEPNDLRRYARVPVAFPVECLINGRSCQGRASLLGGGGLFLRLADGLPSGAEIHLRFQPARQLPSIDANARVCYQVPGRGIGIEFTQIREEDRGLLLQLILHGSTKRRRFPRAPVVVQLQCEDGISLAFGRQLNVGGMFLETHQALPVDARVRLRFHVEKEGEIVEVLAEIKDVVSGFGFGVEFIDIEPSDLKRIETYVSRSLAEIRARSA